MTTEARKAIKLRLDGAKASIKKIPKILQQLSFDDRLRNQYAYLKAHTGRTAGKGAQLQNLKAARTKEEKVWVSEVIRMLEANEPVPSLDMLSCGLRPLLTASKGKKITLADFKSIENRVLAWASGCEAMARVYRTCAVCLKDVSEAHLGHEFKPQDPYIDFAARMEGCDYSEVTAEMRQQAKPGTLGCGFGLGGGQLVRKCVCAKDHKKHTWNIRSEGAPDVVPCTLCGRDVKPGLPQKTGLWRYAEMMGIDLSQSDAQAQVEAFRDTFMEVAQWWYALENAYAAACIRRRPQYVTSTIDGKTACKLTFVYKDTALRIVLPSGRELVYNGAFAREDRTGSGYSKKLVLGYEAARGHGWGIHTTYGGKICENVVQAIAYDALVDALDKIEHWEQDPATGFWFLAESEETIAAKELGVSPMEIIGTTHDEARTEADEKDKTAKARLEGYMSVTPDWAPGLILAADGYEGKRYSKS
jgi:DNA polymerase bacteriophage-type